MESAGSCGAARTERAPRCTRGRPPPRSPEPATPSAPSRSARVTGEKPSVRSDQLETALAQFVHDAAACLQAELDAGAEVPFELESRSTRRRGAHLYCYQPRTEAFIGERWPALAGLESCAAAERLLECLQGL